VPPSSTGAGRVLVIGDVMIDIIVRAEGPLVPGSDRRASIESRQGGSAANQAVWLARFGVRTDFVGRVAEADRAAQEAIFRDAGVNPFLSGDDALPTGRLVAIVDDTGERSFLTDRGANDGLSIDDIPLERLAGAALIHLSAYTFVAERPRAAAREVIACARARSIPVSVDPASTAFLLEIGAARFLEWIAGASIIFPNAAEAAVLTGLADDDAQTEALAGLFPLVVVKRGAAGAEVAAGGARWRRPADPTAAIDSTGAGDAFVAGFLSGWLGGAEHQDSLARAVAAGGLATQAVGGRPA
jgi:sugar/nucleoside kinase (ribokinase family)